MTPEEKRERERLMRMRARKLRAMGRPKMVFQHEFDRALARVRLAHDTGMTARDMAEAIGVNKTTIASYLSGLHTGMRREVFDKIMAMEIKQDIPTGRTRHHGSKVDGTIMRRKLRALLAIGFPANVLGPMIDAKPVYVRYLLLGKTDKVYMATKLAVDALYDKLHAAVPEDYGVIPAYARHARERAAEQGWAPAWTWDVDTVDDPAALPEWTGACGTEEGYRIHIRETVFDHNPLPLCDPCRAAVETRPMSPPKIVFRPDRLAEALKASPLTAMAVARRVVGDDTKPNSARDVLYRWREGSRQPQNMGVVQRLADVLEVPASYLVDEEAMQREADRPVIGHGQFNPYVLRACLEMAGLSHHKAAMLPGSPVTSGAIGKWVAGAMKPSDPSKLQAIADHFGVEVEVFYR